jgi:hypothetical protein
MFGIGKSPGMAINAYVGRLIVTTSRVLFLSTGSNGVAEKISTAMILGPIGGMVFGQTPTSELDLSALNNKGSLSLDLRYINKCEVKRSSLLNAFISITFENFIGESAEYTFMSNWGFSKKWLIKFRDDLFDAKKQLGKDLQYN